MQNTNRRFLAMALLCAMTATLLSAAAQASTGERTGTAQISTGVSKIADVTFPWNDSWFTQDNAVYRHELAAASMALSGAAYLGGVDTGVQAALTGLGFTGVQRSEEHTSELQSH